MDLFSKIKAVVPHMWFQNGATELHNSNDSFELRKRNIRQSSFRNVLKKKFITQKRFSSIQDPRSPNSTFTRSPILRQIEGSTNLAFSPFDVDEMLQIVEERLLISTPKRSIQNANMKNEKKTDEFPEDDKIIGTIQADWNDFEFEQRNGSIPDSLRVETSRLEDLSEKSEEEEEEKKPEMIHEVENNNENEMDSRFNCKIVGFIGKKTQQKDDKNLKSNNTQESTPKTSTPVKNLNRFIHKGIDKRAALTPLRNATVNSPLLINKDRNSSALKNEKLSIRGNKKKKINNQISRKLPKAPSTPLTPLFKSQTHQFFSIINDQENI